MALTPQEMQKRLELALKTGAITQAQFNAKLADIAAQSRSVAPAAAGQGDRNARPHHSNTPNAGRNVGATSGRPRFDNSAYATAPYRFVNFDSNCIVLAEDEARTAINIPKKNGLSAVIDVEWEAESPFLIGAQPQEKGTEPSIVTPLTRTGGGVDYYIPGATLKGAIRSVAEIAAGARLSQVNQDRVFPLRDLNHGLYRPKNNSMPVLTEGQSSYPVSQVNKVRAGWLKLADTSRRPSATRAKKQVEWEDNFVIEPCSGWPSSGDAGWCAVLASDLVVSSYVDLNRAGDKKITRPRSDTDFTRMAMISKYQAIGAFRDNPDRKGDNFINPGAKITRFDDAGTHFQMRRIKPDRAGTIEGCLVFSGRAPALKDAAKLKKIEYAFPVSGKAEGIRVKPEIMRAFRQINSQAIDDSLKPESNWEAALQAFETNPDCAIPVFYVGDLDQQATSGHSAFFFGLTRFFKVPHAWSFGQVLKKSGVSGPLDGNKVDQSKLDMVDALFGYVHELQDENTASLSPADIARKGRVAFSSARLVGEAQKATPIETVMMGPKPSYAPFYLKADPTTGMKDYSAPKCPTLAGRKRYPARMPPGDPATALSRVQEKLKRQIEMVKAATRKDLVDPKTVTSLTFLQPTAAKPVRFQSQIRLFNVTRAEFGLVLWALTFGGRQATHRHMLGRAKPFGAGQTRVSLRKVQIEWNDTAGVIDISQNWTDHLAALDAHVGLNTANKAAVAHMREQLLKTADPAFGDALYRQDKLNGMELANFATIRKMVQRDVDGAAPIKTPLIDI